MIYEISSKTDLSTGVSLIARIPEEELDRQALYTIKSDRPPFVLPFHHKSINGQIEFTFRTETRCKLTYLSGSRSPQDYADLWLKILNPLLDCTDWFMNPYAFVLQAGHVYYDKNTKDVSYIYIPSKKECCDYNDLKEMAAELSKQISVTDTHLENKILRAIMKDFDPQEFLQLLKPWQSAAAFGMATPFEPAPRLEQPVLAPKLAEVFQPPDNKQNLAVPSAAKDIVINLPAEEKPAKKAGNPLQKEKLAKKEKPAKKERPAKKEKPKKKERPKKDQGAPAKSPAHAGLFSKKNKEPQPIILGAAAELLPDHERIQPVLPEHPPSAAFADVTHLIEDSKASGARLYPLSHNSLTKEIAVIIEIGAAFTIGRFDVSIGIAQSSFEFAKNTKAVSRRHAVIEREAGGYYIIDLSSSAGTFVEGYKLPPNTPHRLQRGNRVSFGNAGADYIWEE